MGQFIQFAFNRAWMALVTLLTVLKGLPLTYNRDFQEDKRAVFHADDVLAGSLEALAALIRDATFDPPPPDGSVTALDLAEAFVLRGVPFRTAHEAVGRLVTQAAASGKELSELSGEALEMSDTPSREADSELLDPTASIVRRRTPGGGSMVSVRSQLLALRERLHASE